MATKKTRAARISAAKLSTAVDKAVRIAAQRHDIAVSNTNLLVNWDIVGRIVRDAALAHNFATDVANQVSKAAGINAVATTFRLGRLQIICGFIERARLPAIREML